jgi:plastocyanin
MDNGHAAKRAKKNPKPHPVKITVTPAGDFTYDPSHIRAHKGDTVTFDAGGKPFEVVFKSYSPGDRLYLSNRSPTLTILKNAQHGIHQYAAAVYDETQNRVFLDSGCGEVGVEK